VVRCLVVFFGALEANLPEFAAIPDKSFILLQASIEKAVAKALRTLPSPCLISVSRPAAL